MALTTVSRPCDQSMLLGKLGYSGEQRRVKTDDEDLSHSTTVVALQLSQAQNYVVCLLEIAAPFVSSQIMTS